MTLNKQLINLLGILLAVVVLVAGLALIAYPMFAQAQTLDKNTSTVAQTNAVYQTQIDALSAAEAKSDELDANLAALRQQIAATPKLDDVYEIVDDAAKKADVRVENVTAADPTAWTARTAVDAAGNPIEATPVPAATDAATDTTTDASTSTDAAAQTPATPAASGDSPQQQVTLTVTIDMTLPYEVADADSASSSDSEPDAEDARAAATDAAEKASAFVDALDVGPRLLSPVNVAYADGKLTLSTLAFIRTEDAQ